MALDNVGVYASGMVANAGSKTSADEEAIASGLQSGTVAGAYPRQTFTIVGPNSELIINNNSANGLSMAAGQTFSVSATGTVTFKNLGVIFGTGNFTLLSGCTLKTQNTAGITAATGTLTGCVVTTGGRTFNTGANYVYNGTALQSTGTGLPTAFVSPGSVTVDNTFSVTLTSATTMGANDTVNLKTGAFNIGAGLTFNTATAYIQIDNGSFNIAPTFSVGNAVNIIYKSLNYGGTASTSSITTGLEIPTATNILKDFTINKGSATITLASTPTVNGTVTMTAGLLNLSTFDLNVSAASPAVAPGTFTTSNMIIANSTGQLKKQFSGNGSYLYPIGDATNYTPITLSVTGATYPGGSYAGANLRGVKHPNNANTTDFINRYWSVSLSGITSPTTSVTAATYVVGDVVGTEANIAMGQYPGATPWIRTTTTNAVTHTLTTAPSTFTNAASDFSGISVAADGPTVTLASATVPCGSVHTFTAVATRDAPYTYSWAPSTGLSATTGAIVTSSSTVTTTYTVTLTDGNGFTASATATLTVTPFVPNVFPTTALYCAGGGALVTTTASGGASYIWTPGGATTNTLAVGPPSNTVYTVTATSSLGCVGINTFSVTVGTTPTVTVSPQPLTRCSTDLPNILTAGTANSYVWSPGGATTNTISVAPASSTTYTVIGTNTVVGSAGTCTVSQTAFVSVNVTPTISITGGGRVCFSGSTIGNANLGFSSTGSPNEYSLTWVSGPLANVPAYAPLSSPSITVSIPAGTPANTYSATVTVANSSAPTCTSNTNIVVTVNQLPIPTFTLTPAASVCAGTNVNYGTQSPEGIYTWSVSGTAVTDFNYISPSSFIGTFTSNTLQIQWVTSGTKSVSVKYTDLNGCAAVAPVVFVNTVYASPTVSSISNTSPICAGGVVTLNATSATATNYSWTGPNSFASTAQNPTATPTLTGTYSLTVSNPGCSPLTVSTTIATVNLAPASTGATNNGPICATGTATLTANSSNATAWLWTGSDATTSTLQNPTVSPTVTTTYTLTLSAGPASGCNPGIPYITTVSVNTTPSSTGATNNGPICATGTATLTANSSNATAWLWVGSDASTSTLQNPVVTPTVTTTYSLTVSAAPSGCQPTTVYPTTVTVNATPTSTGATNNGPICATGTATLTANSSNATAWLWTGSDASTSTLQNPTVSPSGTTTYSLTVSAPGSGCQPTTNYPTTVSVNPTPSSTGATNNGPICVGGSAILADHSSNATAWLWVGSDASSTTVQSPTVSPTVTTTYTLTVSAAPSGCQPATPYVTVVSVNLVPTSTGATNSGPICATGTATLTANSSNATAWLWTGSDASSTTIQNPVVSPTTTTTYTLTVSSVGNGCQPTTPYVTVLSVNPTPSAAPTNSGPICLTTSATLFANPNASVTNYSWTGPNSFASTDQNPIVTPTVTSTYTLVVSSTLGTSGCNPGVPVTTTVTVNTVAAAAPSGSGPICLGGTETLSANPVGGTASQFTWTGPTPFSSTAQNPTFSPTVSGTYSLVVGAPGCTPSGTYTVGVTVGAQPALTGLSSSATNPFCSGGAMTLTATSTGGAGTPTYSWSGPGIAATTGSSASSPFTTTAGAATGAYSVSLSYNGNGCIAAGPFASSVYTLTAQPALTGLSSTATNPFCGGGTMTLTATSTGGAGTASYIWSGPGIATTTNATSSTPFTTATGAASGAYSVTLAYTGTGCVAVSTVTASYTLNNQANLSALVSTATNPLCTGGVMTLSATSTGGAGASVYTWSGPDVTTVTSATSVSPSITTSGAPTTGAYSVTVAYDGTGCNSATTAGATYTITAQPTLASLTSSASNPFCAGGTMTLTATTGLAGAGTPFYTWSGPGIATTTSASLVSPSFTTATVSATGAYSAVVTYSGTGCNSSPFTSAVYTLTAQPVLTGLSSSATNPFCGGATMTLTATSTGGAGNPTYTWTGGPGITGTTSTTGSQAFTTAAGAASGAYSVTLAYDGTGCIATSTVSASYTLNNQANLSALVSTATNPLCTGGVMTLSATSTGGAGASVYTWSGPDVTTVTSTTNVSPSIATSGAPTTGAYSVTVAYNGTGCNSATTAGATYTITAQPTLASLTSSASNPFCAGATMTLTATTGLAGAGTPFYTWSGPGIATTTSATLVSPSFTTSTVSATGAYSAVVTYSGTGCNSSPFTSAVYTLTAQPVLTSLTSSATNPFCGGGTMSLTATSTGGAGTPTYVWNGPAIFSTTGSSNVAAFTTLSVSGTAAYSVTLSYDGTGCTSTSTVSATYTLTAQPSVTGLVSDATNPLCVGGSMILTATYGGGGAGNPIYTWTGPSITATTGSSPVSPSIPTSGAPATGAYSVTLGYDGTGCATTVPFATAAIYTVSAQPSISALTSSATNPFCAGGVMTLTATSAGGAGPLTYTWSGPGIISATSSTNVSPSFTTLGVSATGAYSVTIGAAGTGCTTSAPFAGTVYTINLQPQLTSLTSSATNPFCGGGTMTLTATSIGGGGTPTYTWSGPAITSNTSSASTSSFTTTATGATGAYSVTLNYANTGCVATSTVSATTYTVTPQPAVTSLSSSAANPLCTGGTMTLTASGITAGAGNPTYTWSGPGIVTTTSSTPVSPSFTPSVAGTTIGAYSVTLAYDGSSCTTAATATATYTVSPQPVTMTGTAIVCNLSTTALTDAPTGGVWTSGSVNATVDGSGNVTGVNAGTATISYSFGTCYSSDVVTINPTPAPITGVYSVYITATTTLSDPDAGGTWSSNNSNVTVDGSGNVLGNTVGTSVVSYAYATGCNAIAVVTVNPLYPITGNLAVCEAGGTTTLSDLTLGGTWSSPDATVTVVGSANSALVTGVTAGTATVSYILGGASTTAIVTINPLPTAILGYTTLCLGGSSTLSDAGSGTWTSSAGGVATIGTAGDVSTVGIGTTGITYTLPTGCKISTVLSVNAAPSAAPTNNGYICNGGTVTLSANPANGANTFTWVGANLVTTTGATPTATPTSTSVYTLTVSDGTGNPGCAPSTPYNTTVSVNATPTVAAGNSSYICVGGTATLTATTTGGTVTTYAWTDGVSYTSTLQNPITTPTVNTTYSVTVTDGSLKSGCVSTTSTVVTVNAQPTVAAGNSSYICVGGTATLTATITGGTVTTYAWTDGVAYSSTLQNPITTPTVNTTYSVTVTDGSTKSGCVSTTSTLVTVNAIPKVAAGNSSYICVGGTATLTATTTGGTVTTYAWTDGVAYSSTLQNPVTTPTVNTTYSVTVTDGSLKSGCVSTSSTLVTVNAIPTVAAGNSSYICVGGTATLTATTTGGTVTTYAWTDGVAYSSTLQNPITTPTVNTTYSVTVTDGSLKSGCVSTTSTVVTVNAKPTVAASNSSYICVGGTATLTATTTGGTVTTYAWTDGVAYSSTLQNPITTPTVNTTYSVTVTDGSTQSGCVSTTSTLVTVNAIPTVAAGNSSYICVGGTATLTATTTGGTVTTYAWTDGVSYTSTLQNPITTPTVNTTYSVTVTDGSTQSGCVSTTSTEVTVNAIPTVIASNSSYICVGGTASLTATPSGGSVVNYTWAGSTITGGGGTATATAAPTATGINTYTVTVDDGSTQSGCSSMATTDVTVNATPTVTTSNSSYICVGGTASLTATPSGGSVVNYTWTGSTITGGGSTAMATAAPTAIGINTYTVTVDDGSTQSGCSSTATTDVTVNATPTATATNTSYICVGGTATLTATATGGSVVNYTWAGAIITGGGNTATATAAPTVTGVNTYTVTVDDGSTQSGCSSTATTDVTVNATPTAAPSNNGYICIGGAVTLSANPANGANTYIWNGVNLAATSGITTTATPTVTGVYSLMVSDGSTQSGCAPLTVYTTTVNVHATPISVGPGNNGYICNGGTVILSGNPDDGANTYFWSGPGLLATSGVAPSATPSVTSTYTLTVSDGTNQPGCAPLTEYYTTVIVHITPTANPTNDGPICVGGTVNLTAAQSGASVFTWTGPNLGATNIADPSATPTVVGVNVYTLVVSDGSTQPGCTPSTQYYDNVTVKDAPTATISNDGPVCATFTLNLLTTTANNVLDYAWTGPVAITNPTSANASVPNATTAATGVYTLTADNGPGSACAITLTTAATVNALPIVDTVTGGGAYCFDGDGKHIGLNSSTMSIEYDLYNGILRGTVIGDGNPLDFGAQFAAGTYTVLATNLSTTCTNVMYGSATITVNPLPVSTYSVLASGTHYCAGQSGIDIYLSNSDLGINYSLYLGSYIVDTLWPGNGTLLDLGYQTHAGDYYVGATDATTGCFSYMTGAASITVDSLPTVYNMSGGGAYCAGNNDTVRLSGSDGGITYSLMTSSVLGSINQPGTGAMLTYAPLTDTGTVTILATNNTTACTSFMAGSITISVNPVPAIDTLTGGGTYCQGTGGVNVGLNGSETGVNYKLYNGALLSMTMAGTGSAFTYTSTVTASGNYTVAAVNATTGCTSNMYGVDTVIINAAPAVYNMTGGNNYCANLAGTTIGLNDADTGITYTLYNAATSAGTMTGVDTAFNFTGLYAAGTYSVLASNNTTACTSVMNGLLTVTVNALPTIDTVTGGGSYCAGAGGVVVGMNAADAATWYILHNGATVIDSMTSGGTAFNFPAQPAGVYSVTAVNIATGCSSNMDSFATVIVNPLVTPAISVTTGVGDTVCFGNMITYTANIVNGGLTPAYQWFVNGVNTGTVTSTYAYTPNNGDVVMGVLTSSANCASPATVSASDTMTVEVSATPSVAINVNPGTTVCNGTSVTFTALPSYGGSVPTFNWSTNGTFAFSGTSYTYTPANGDNVTVAMTSNFTCVSTDTASHSVMMNVGTPTVPVVVIVASPGTDIATGETETLTAFVTNAGSSVSYQWVVNSTVIAGATNAVYSSNAFNNNDSVTCQVINNNGCNLGGFNSVKIRVYGVGVKQVTFGTGDIRLLPNPNSGDFSVKGTLGTTADEEITMEVTDMMGQVVYKNKVVTHGGIIDEKVTLNNTLANGMYIMNLRSGSDTKIFHFVIEQ